jgi:hypothetical protein
MVKLSLIFEGKNITDRSNCRYKYHNQITL